MAQKLKVTLSCKASSRPAGVTGDLVSKLDIYILKGQNLGFGSVLEYVVVQHAGGPKLYSQGQKKKKAKKSP